MPDSFITQSTLTVRRPKRPCAKDQPLLDADQMRALWGDLQTGIKNYREEDEERTGAVVLDAEDRLINARTVDPLGVAYKLRATRTWRDATKGLADDLESPDRVQRTIATIIRDLEAESLASRPARRMPSRLRPLWEAYQKTWKAVSDAGDEEDAAMLARPKDAPRKRTQAEKDTERNMELARKAYSAASDALEAAPTLTVDDALCRIEHAIDLADEGTNADLINSLNKALRVLRKASTTS